VEPVVLGHTGAVPEPDRLIGSVTARLSAAGCVAAEEEAAELVAVAPDAPMLESFVLRREAGEPLAWITGGLRFCGHRILVDRGVYVPRRQSEELALRAAARLARDPGGSAVDLCTGAGAVAVHLMAVCPGTRVIGVDDDRGAVTCARRNGVRVVRADLDPPLRSGIFEVVTAVAPYVPTGELRLLPADVQRYEPRRSLDGGEDGLDLVRRVVCSAARLLRRGGWVVLELGGHQDRALAPTLAATGFGPGEPWFDSEGDLRGIAARRGG
jgi:release factor glutamine methyltransferase